MDSIVRWYIERAYDEQYETHNKDTHEYEVLRTATINLYEEDRFKILLRALELAVKDVG